MAFEIFETMRKPTIAICVGGAFYLSAMAIRDFNLLQKKFYTLYFDTEKETIGIAFFEQKPIKLTGKMTTINGTKSGSRLSTQLWGGSFFDKHSILIPQKVELFLSKEITDCDVFLTAKIELRPIEEKQ